LLFGHKVLPFTRSPNAASSRGKNQLPSTQSEPQEGSHIAGLSAQHLETIVLSGIFDSDFYLHAYPDVAQVGINPFIHYLRHGRFEKRKASVTFDPTAYLEANPDVVDSGLEPFLHYVLIGRASSAPRSPTEISCREFDLNYDTAAGAVGLSQDNFETIMQSNIFDREFYLQTYPDVAQAGMSPLLHYLRHGRFEKRKASVTFDPTAYLEANPDVVNSGLEPFLHYALIGRASRAPRSLAEVILRHIGLDLNHMEASTSTIGDLLNALRKSSEYDDVIEPIIKEINYVFETFLFTAPTPRETLKSIINFYQNNNTANQRSIAINNNNIRHGLEIRPFSVEMDIVNQCNLRCTMCHFSSPQYFTKKKKEISVSDFSKTAEQLFPLCSQVSLSISTEPLLHRNIEGLLNITRKYKIPFVYMYTNGILLNQGIIDCLVKAKVNQLSISIDGATKQTYERIRVGAKFDRLIANIELINLAKLAVGSETPHICFNTVLMRSNIAELPTLVRLAHSLRVRTIAAVHMVKHDITAVDPEESLQYDKNLYNHMMEEAQELAAKFGIETYFPERFAGDNQDKPPSKGDVHPIAYPTKQQSKRTEQASCRFPWHFVGLDSEGNLIPCGWWFKQAPMGNVLAEPFEVIWNNENYRRLRSEHKLRRKLRAVCQTCPMGNANDMNYFRIQ
jgi:radical SAM protein with 4Fe4S-binding SPASM domain